tara:strand:- start:1386 stop:1703 length:318 start_codon:yes stop_codon:yes gene_type:complete
MTIALIILILLLLCSVALNALMIWYNRKAVNGLFLMTENIDVLIGLKEEYLEHLNSLYELEMFYGDSTLKGLIDHTEFMITEIKSFDKMYSLLKEEDFDDDTEET